MSMEEKYGNFSVKNLIFYDEDERKRFEEKFIKPYQKHISKMEVISHDGKKKVKQNWQDRRTNKSYLGWLNLQIKLDEDNNTLSMVGYGHRNAIFPIEFYLRKLFDDERIVYYDIGDNLNRSFDVDSSEAEKEVMDFYTEARRRLELYKKGELKPPAYRSEEEQKRTK